MQLKLFVELASEISQKCLLSMKNAQSISLPNGGNVKLTDPVSKTSTICRMEASPETLDFSIRIAKDVLNNMNFTGLEIILEAASGGAVGIPASSSPQMQTPSVSTPSMPQMQNSISSSSKPQMATPTKTPSMPQMSTPVGAPSMPNLAPPPGSPSMPNLAPPPGSSTMSQMQPPGMPGMNQIQMPQGMNSAIPVDPYPNKVPLETLMAGKVGSIILSPKKSMSSLNGRVLINQKVMNNLGLFPNALIGWEDPLTRSKGSARVDIGNVDDYHLEMDENTLFDANVAAPQLCIYTMEPPITHVQQITLEIESKPDLDGFLEVNHRNGLSLQIQEGEILSFEDELTGAFGAGRVRFNSNVGDKKVVIDQELIEASGVGSYEVELKKNIREVIPLQSIELGVSPITGENVWEIISMARTNIDPVKKWIGNYILFKGSKLRWKQANIAVEILHSVPDLSGDALAFVPFGASVELKPLSLVTFNAILIIDISRSMMARDVAVTNIGPALEGIKSAMHDPEIQEFLTKFKPGTNVPRRLSAAFSAILFLSEKVGRGFGEKVSVIRFADEAQIMPMVGEKLWMDSSSGQKGDLEHCAKTIVQDIGNAYGQATNLGLAMEKAQSLLQMFEKEDPDQPTMIVLLTDGSPTDGDAFLNSIESLSKNQNVVLYIIGLGNPDDELMKKAAAKCAGEYFKPEDSGELLVWYSKRARDLSLKLRRDEK